MITPRIKGTLLLLILCLFFKAQQNQYLKTLYSSNENDSVRIKAAQSLCMEYSSNDPDSCIIMADLGIELSQKSSFKKCLPWLYKLKGVAYVNKSDYKSSLACYLEGLKIAEQQRNIKEVAAIYSNIGVNFWYQKEYRTALRYHRISLNKRIQLGDYKEISKSYNNIGTVEVELGNYQKALWHYKAAMRIKDSLHDEIGIANSNNNIGIVYEKMRNYKEAKKHYENALNIFLDKGDLRGQVVSYNNIAGTLKYLKESAQGIIYAGKALKLAEELGDLEDVKLAYEIMAICYHDIGKLNEAYDYLMKYSRLNDSLKNENIVQEIQEMEKKYQSVKQEQEINILAKDNKIKDIEIRQHETGKKYLVLILILAALIILLAAVGFVKIRNQNKILGLNKIHIEEKNNVLEHQKKEIIDSINYAKRIQNSLLANDEFISQHLAEHFILFKPKDIVSGDFYWATEADRRSLQGQPDSQLSTFNSQLFYLAVCDCTGHGVPGAFMSVMSIGFLSEAINEKGIEEPHNVFNYVRKRLIQNMDKEGQKDGFDGVLLCIDKENKKITYAAANNRLVLIRNGRLEELTVDKMPVGIGVDMKEFTSHTIDISPGDSLYLYTDGYADQFGGPKGKKFKYRELNKIILESHHLTMTQQKSVLDNSLETWKGNLEQVDDILVMGIRF